MGSVMGHLYCYYGPHYEMGVAHLLHYGFFFLFLLSFPCSSFLLSSKYFQGYFWGKSCSRFLFEAWFRVGLRSALSSNTLRFFIKFVSQADSSNIYRPSEWTRKQKMVSACAKKNSAKYFECILIILKEERNGVYFVQNHNSIKVDRYR